MSKQKQKPGVGSRKRKTGARADEVVTQADQNPPAIVPDVIHASPMGQDFPPGTDLSSFKPPANLVAAIVVSSTQDAENAANTGLLPPAQALSAFSGVPPAPAFPYPPPIDLCHLWRIQVTLQTLQQLAAIHAMQQAAQMAIIAQQLAIHQAMRW